MRKSVVLTCIILATAVGATSKAAAKPLIKTKTDYYSVKGSTGSNLLSQMNKRGPKHGWWARSIAQTRYTTSWGASWRHRDGACRAFKAPVELSVTFVYPRLDGAVSATLKKRWNGFMTGVTKHEKYHGDLARKMVFAVEKEILSTNLKTSDTNCRGMKQLLGKRVDSVMNDYERRQKAFDRTEHRDGGNVDKLVLNLIGKAQKKNTVSANTVRNKIGDAPIAMQVNRGR